MKYPEGTGCVMPHLSWPTLCSSHAASPPVQQACDILPRARMRHPALCRHALSCLVQACDILPCVDMRHSGLCSRHAASCLVQACDILPRAGMRHPALCRSIAISPWASSRSACAPSASACMSLSLPASAALCCLALAWREQR